MASRISINMARFIRRKEDYIAKVTSHVPEVSRVGLETLISELMARCPSPSQEAAAMNGSQYESYSAAFPARMDDNREADRDRFFHPIGTFPVQVAIALPEVWTPTARGFQGPSARLMDELTRYAWTNVQRDRKSKLNTPYTYESTHGTFLPFEYGLRWEVTPKSAEGTPGKHFLSPAPYVYAESATKSVPALSIVRGVNTSIVLQAMADTIREVQF